MFGLLSLEALDGDGAAREAAAKADDPAPDIVVER